MGELSEGPTQKCAEAVPGGVLEGRDAERIVAARQAKPLEVHVIVANRVKKCIRELGPERRVKAAADSEKFFACAVKLRDVGKRADGRPIAAQIIGGKFRLQRFPNVHGRETARDDVAKIVGDVKECSSPQRRLVAHGDEGYRRPDTGPENAQAVVSLPLEPAEGHSDVNDGLAIGLQSESDVRPDQMIAAGMAWNGPAVMIGEAHLDRGDSQAVQPATDVLLLLPARIPLGQDDDCRSPAPSAKYLCVHAIIFGPGRVDRACKREDLPVE